MNTFMLNEERKEQIPYKFVSSITSVMDLINVRSFFYTYLRILTHLDGMRGQMR